MSERLEHLQAGERIMYGGDRVTTVSPALAAAFQPGDRLVVVHETGDLLHIPAAEHAVASEAVGAATQAFTHLAATTDEQISDFFHRFAALLADDTVFAPIAAANEADVASALQRGRATGRLTLSPKMRADMIDGLRVWRDIPTRRRQMVSEVRHDQWTVEQWRDPLGVVGFVFEGRPNVFADATGVLRTGNTVVFRIGSDALGTARAIMQHAVVPALRGSGLPDGCVVLVDSAAHAAGWALFADTRLGLAVARGSGAAVAQLGAVARQHGVPASLHGTGGAWLVAGESADTERFALSVRHSLDRKVCNTVNVVCIVRSRAADLLPAFREAAKAAGEARGVDTIVHEVAPDDPLLAHEFEWDTVPEVAVMVVDDVAQAVQQCNAYSPHFVASLISTDPAEHQWFYGAVDAPFMGDGFTRWVDGQFALLQPELGLSNWQAGRLFGRGGVLSGDSVYTVRLRARVSDPNLHR
ncbi:MAG TPA: aldehyde dehydrogenase family protein [Ilumatobacteraceae bacterium]|nr:aldehyde dehydrogenase family protein [Ilumatobacteraceae bacterium]